MDSSFILPFVMLKPKGTPVYVTAKNGKTGKSAGLTIYGFTEKQVRDAIRRLFEDQPDQQSIAVPHAGAA